MKGSLFAVAVRVNNLDRVEGRQSFMDNRRGVILSFATFCCHHFFFFFFWSTPWAPSLVRFQQADEVVMRRQ